MDVILAQLGSRELESHCRDAMKMQLKAMQCALNDAMDAAKRAEEVQLASQKLSTTLFEEGSELSSALLASTRLRDELSQLLERVVERTLGAGTERVRPPLEKSPTPEAAVVAAPQKTSQKKRKASTQKSEDASTKKHKRSSSVASEHVPNTPAKLAESVKKPKSTAILSKALAYCTKLTEELAKMKKVADRVPELKTLVSHFNTAHKNLDPNSIIDQIEALDTLSVAAGMAVSIMQHGKPSMKRHWVHKFRDNIAAIQELFPDSAAAFNGYINALTKIISNFPLTIKEGQRMRMRLRKTLDEVKGWKDGHYSIADATQNMGVVAEALESTCPNWIPRDDKTVRELTALLLKRVEVFKDNKKQAKRKKKLQSWLDEMEHVHPASQETTTRAASKPKISSTKSSKPPKEISTAPSKPSCKSTAQSKARKGSPHLAQKQSRQQSADNAVPAPSVSSTESSDTEPTQLESSIKVEVSD